MLYVISIIYTLPCVNILIYIRLITQRKKVNFLTMFLKYTDSQNVSEYITYNLSLVTLASLVSQNVLSISHVLIKLTAYASI